MKAIWITMMALAPVCATAQDIPPLAPLRGDAATLKDTMKFIQEKLPGKVNYVAYWHDNVAGTDLNSQKQIFDLSNVTAEADRCSVRYHVHREAGSNKDDVDSGVSLKQVREITLAQLDAYVQQVVAKAGKPERTVKIDPPVFLVVVLTDARSGVTFHFYDEALAERVTKALQHAMELCGGGNKDPF